MAKVLLTRKIEMTRQFRPDGAVVPVTILSAEPCVVTQVKSVEKDGYVAVQVGEGNSKHLSKSVVGHLKSAKATSRTLKEFRVVGEYTVGQTLDVTQFAPGDMVTVHGVSKGRGFQGVVKRHHFHGHPTTHGHKDQARMPGSIGAGGVQHVRKGKRMAGHMGDDNVTLHHLEVIAVDVERKQLIIKGAVPGARRGLVVVEA